MRVSAASGFTDTVLEFQLHTSKGYQPPMLLLYVSLVINMTSMFLLLNHRLKLLA